MILNHISYKFSAISFIDMDKEEFLQRYKDGQRDFSNLDLRKIDLYENDLSGCNFNDSDLRQANLTLCNLSNVDFTNAKLEWTFFQGAKIDSKTILSSKYLLAWQLVNEGVFDEFGGGYYQFRPDKNNSKRDFRYQNLSYGNLCDADLTNLDFTGANFYQSRLDGTDLSHVNLSGANLEKAYLHLANLKGSIIDKKTKLDDKWRLVWELVNEGGKNRNLEGVDLRGANLAYADLTGVNLKNANLTKANLSYCNLTDANLKGANLTETQFYQTILINTILIDVKTDNTEFCLCTTIDTIFNNISAFEYTIKILNQKNNDQYIHVNEINVEGYNLSHLDLRGYNFSQCYLSNTNFSYSNLINCNFSKCRLGEYEYPCYNVEHYFVPYYNTQSAANFSYTNLINANFSEADLNHVNFSGANLQNANLTKADLSHADLTGADLRGADLENAKLDYVNLRATIIDESTKISEKWRFIWEFINSEYPQKYNLKGVDFSYIRLDYFDLSGCDLSNINLSHSKINNCNFSNSDLSQSNFEEAEINETKFDDANLQNSNLKSLRGKDNDFIKAIFNNSNAEKARLRGNLSHAQFINCNLISASIGKDLYKANFYDSNLTKVSLQNSNLSQANFENANLEEAILRLCELRETNFTNANLQKVEFFSKVTERDCSFIEGQIEIAIINNTNLKGTIFENKFIDKKTQIIQDHSLLVSLQRDFIHRLESGHLLNCELIGYHSELTIVEGDKLEKLRDYCWQMVTKFRNSRLEPKRIFVNNLTGKLGEEVVKNRLGDLVNTVDYEIYDRGDGGIDLTLKNDDNLGIQVKTRTGDNIQDIQWKITKKEIETNIALVCIYSQERVTEAQLHYHLILSGFMPTNEIKSEENEVFFSIENLYYGGGLKGYLENYS